MGSTLQLRRSFARDFAPLCELESAIHLVDGPRAAWSQFTLGTHAADRSVHFLLAELPVSRDAQRSTLLPSPAVSGRGAGGEGSSKPTDGNRWEPTSPVIGYLAFRAHDFRLDLLRLAVHPTWRRQSIATTLVARVMLGVSDSSLREAATPRRLTAAVPQALLPAQRFFSALGFRCVNTWPPDHYLFTYRAAAPLV